MTDLGTLGGAQSSANGVNASGQVVGWSLTADGSVDPFLYSGGSMIDLDTLSGIAYGINDSGQVVGQAVFAGKTAAWRAFLYSGGIMTNLGTLGGFSYAYGINACGVIVGASAITEGVDEPTHAVVYLGGSVRDLGALGFSSVVAMAVNHSGQIVGYGTIPGGAATHAFLYSGGDMTDLGTLGGPDSYALGINDSGQVVGAADGPGGARDAFLYSGGVMIDLNSLLPAGSGWVLQGATGINNKGQIAGYGQFTAIQGGPQDQGFILDTAAAPGLPDSWSVAMAHSGSFTQDQSGATYLLDVSNANSAGPTSGTVTVQDRLPAGLTLAAMSGTGWTCLADTCTRSDALDAGSSYPAIAVTVNVTRDAPSRVLNQATVSGGGLADASASEVTTIQTTAQFNDVPPGATYFDAANLMFQAGVTTGCVEGSTPQARSYCPDQVVTRQEMAAFIDRAIAGATNPAIYNPTPYFQDVPDTNPFFAHIQNLMQFGITTGCSHSPALYCPYDAIPRWEMAMVLIRARLMLFGQSFAASTIPYFADAPTDVEGTGMPFPFIQRAFEEQVTNGCGTSPLVYCPDQLVTRGEMASFVMRALFNETMTLCLTAPQLTGVSPNALPATLGSQITVTITSVNTYFQNGDTLTVPSGMLTVSDVTVNAATSITATLTTNSTTVGAPQSLVVTSGGQNLTLPLAIKVGTY
jgi:probable HAF family extracellular repeat protein